MSTNKYDHYHATLNITIYTDGDDTGLTSVPGGSWLTHIWEKPAVFGLIRPEARTYHEEMENYYLNHGEGALAGFHEEIQKGLEALPPSAEGLRVVCQLSN